MKKVFLIFLGLSLFMPFFLAGGSFALAVGVQTEAEAEAEAATAGSNITPCAEGYVRSGNTCVRDDSSRDDSSIELNTIFTDQSTDLKTLVKKIISFLNSSIMAISVLGAMIGGIVMMTASGDDGQISKGKDILTYSVIGLVITISAYLIITFAQSILYSIGT